MKPTTATVAARLRAPIIAAATLTGLGLALCATALPAVAGDLDNGAAGGAKDYGYGGTPVPAPVPYEEHFQWYVRGDYGSAFKNTGTFPLTGGSTVLEPNNWTDLSILSVGFGRYITPNFRVEYTLDYRPQRNISTYTTQTSATLSNVVEHQNGELVNWVHNYVGTTTDDTTYQNETFLMSAFYDFNREGKFHPYVGAGIGIAAHQLQRTSAGTMSCHDGTYQILGDPTLFDDKCATGASGLPAVLYTSSVANSTGYGLAGQLSAGISYEVSSRIHWDTGYRMLWQSGHIGAVSADGLSAVHVGDTIGHEVRTGVRWDLW